MKKFYTFLAATAVIASASATDLGAGKTLKTEIGKKSVAKTETSMQMAKIGKTVRGLQSIRKADADVSSIEGTWDFVLGDYYFQDSSVGEFTAQITVSLQGDMVVFESEDVLPFFGTYNASTSTITFERSYISPYQGYYVYQSPYAYDYKTQDLIPQSFSVKYDAAQGILVIPNVEGQTDYGMSWIAYTDEAGVNSAGYFDILDFVYASKAKPTPGGDDSNWKDLGKAKFVDGWVLPAFNEDQFALEFEVPLQQNLTDPNLYRLVDPYHNELYGKINTSTKKGYIMFDVSDPDHVFMEKCEAGFSNSELNISSLYCYNQLSLYYQYFNGSYPVETILQIIGDLIPSTTFKDGVVSFSYIDDPEEGRIYDANFGVNSSSFGYSWQDQDGKPADMSARITFPSGDDGVDTIGVSDDSKFEYFDLLGRRVVNPAEGTIVIKRSGNKASKVIF